MCLTDTTDLFGKGWVRWPDWTVDLPLLLSLIRSAYESRSPYLLPSLQSCIPPASLMHPSFLQANQPSNARMCLEVQSSSSRDITSASAFLAPRLSPTKFYREKERKKEKEGERKRERLKPSPPYLLQPMIGFIKPLHLRCVQPSCQSICYFSPCCTSPLDQFTLPSPTHTGYL